MSDSFQPHGLWPARLLCPWNPSGKNTGVGSQSLLQGIFLIQGLNPGLPHCRQILYHLSHQGSPFRVIEEVVKLEFQPRYICHLSPVEGNGKPVQYSCLENPLDIAAWQATVQGVASVGQNLATKPPPPCLPPKPMLFGGTETQKMALVWVSKPD